VNIKFGTKFIIALCDVFKKIAQKCHPVTCKWFLRNDVITNFFK
jgi:hypothetical protein